MKQREMYPHRIALAAMFTLGNVLLRYPWRELQADLPVAFLLTAAGAVIPAFLLCPLFARLFRRPMSKHPAGAAVAGAVAVSVGLYALLVAYRAAADCLFWLTHTVLPNGGLLLPAVLFSAVAILCAKLPRRGLCILTLLFFAIAVGSAVLLFLFGLPHFRWEQLTSAFRGKVLPESSSLWVLLREMLLPSAVLAAYFALTVPQSPKRPLAVGILAGYLLLALCILQVLLTFGADYAAELPHPYSYAARIISVGPYFFRLEGFSYLPDLLGCLIRAAVALAVAKHSLHIFCRSLAIVYKKFM